MTLSEAERLAKQTRERLAPFCKRCEIAGSTRRKKMGDIHDIEIVCIPNNAHLFELRNLVNNGMGRVDIGEFPSKYTRIRSPHNIDLFWVTPESWGLQFFIRTGPADYVAAALAYWKKITNGGFSNGGILHLPDATIVPTPEEEDVFRVLEERGGKPCRFTPPERRFKKH